MLAIGAPNTGFPPPRMEALHGLEVFTVDISFTEPQFVARPHHNIEVLGVDRRCKTVLAVVRQFNGLVEVFECGDR